MMRFILAGTIALSGVQDGPSAGLQNSWLLVSQSQTTVACQYEVQVRWIALAPSGEPGLQSSGIELFFAKSDEAAEVSSVKSLHLAFDELWKANDPHAQIAGPTRYRIQKGNSCIMQELVGDIQRIELRAPEVTLSYSGPKNELVVGIGSENHPVAMFDPRKILNPLPSGTFLDAWDKLDWVQVRPNVLRAKHSSDGAQSTVLLNEEGLPIAFWDRAAGAPSYVFSGFYDWSVTDKGERRLDRALYLHGDPDHLDATMYDLSDYAELAEGVGPVMVLDDGFTILDIRKGGRSSPVSIEKAGISELVIVLPEDPKRPLDDHKK